MSEPTQPTPIEGEMLTFDQVFADDFPEAVWRTAEQQAAHEQEIAPILQQLRQPRRRGRKAAQ